MRPVRAPGAWVALVLVLCVHAPASAQGEPPAAPPIPTELESIEGRPSPRSAMFRSFLLPGWGQASYDRYLRGGVYFMGHTGNIYMVLKTLSRLDEANDIESRRVAAAEARFLADGADPDSIDALVDADPSIIATRELVTARESHREDWIALGLFWVLISGVDAYVNAQLADFPASIGAVTDGRRHGVMVSVPVR